MTDAAEDSTNFINQMYAAVIEESALWELPGGSTDLLPDGPVVHGPWNAHDCSAVITRWHNEGWVEPYLPDLPAGWNVGPADWQRRAERRDAFLILDAQDARQLLQDPQRWTVETADGQVCLSRSVAGMATDPKDWMAIATAL